jgi:maltokinase
VTSLVQILTDWLPGQRWFAAKGVQLERIDLASQSRLFDDLDGAAVDHVLVEVESPLGVQHYQLFIGWRETVPENLQRWAIGELDGRTGYDALHDPGFTSALIAGLAAGREWGELRLIPEPGAVIDPSATGRVLSGEQSNTSIIYTAPATSAARDPFGGILKVYRRLEPGTNPDVEVHRALHKEHSFSVARPLAVLEADLDGQPTTLGFLSAFFRAAEDGWDLATSAVAALLAASDGASTAPSEDGNSAPPSEDGNSAQFTEESKRLGATVGEIHRDLAHAFTSRELSRDAWQDVVGAMITEAQRVAGFVPPIAERLDRIVATFERARDLDTAVVVQRVHGDLHLGQTLRTPTGWAVIDFEGEPAKSLAERKSHTLAAKDVAGMLRSFDYAANHLRPSGVDSPEQVAAATEWATANREAFLAGYASVDGAPPLGAVEVITAFELDKAVYEVAYEHGNRPSWTAIPLHAVDNLIES